MGSASPAEEPNLPDPPLESTPAQDPGSPERAVPGTESEDYLHYDGELSESLLAETLLEATRPMVAIATRALAAQEDQVTIVQYRALLVLATHEPCNLSRLSDALGVHASTATRMCDRLVSRDLIGRVRSRDSRREVQLTLTERGRELVDAETRRRRSEVDRIVAAIPPEQRAAAWEGLRAVIDAASEVLGRTWPQASETPPMSGQRPGSLSKDNPAAGVGHESSGRAT